MNKTFKKVIALLLVVCLTAAIAVGGTLAYLTDRDSEANVFTVGDVNIDLNENFSQGATLLPGRPVVKAPSVTNVGPNDAWVWVTVAVPATLDSVIEFDGQAPGWVAAAQELAEAPAGYVLHTFLYDTALENGEETTDVFQYVTLSSSVDVAPNGDWYSVVAGAATSLGWDNDDGNPVIYVSAYGIQKDGFTNAAAAYAAYYEQWGPVNGSEYGDPIDDIENTTIVSTADELVAALAAGGKVALNNDIELSSTITIPAGTTAALNLNGKTLSYTAAGTGNRDMILVKGNLTVTNGNLEMNATTNDGWNSMSSIFDVTDGGVLNLDGVTAVNNGGTDMNFVVHLNNWGEVTLNVTNSTLKATYVAVRVYNSGPNMNNVTIEDTVLEGKHCFWVHNYTEADHGSAAKADAQKALLNLDICNNGNTFINAGVAPIRLGFTNEVYCDANGDILQLQ